jgi:hypothetical protein
LRARDSRDGRECGSTGCQVQKSTAGKFHGLRPGDTKAIPIPVPRKGAAISSYGTNETHDSSRRISAH